jgi:kojibiose phosphorylase
MKKILDNLITLSGWEIIEKGYDKSGVIISGSNFMTGNGYLGYRGTAAEEGKEDYAGCFVTDTWDKADGKWEELCNVPNALFTEIYCDDIKLSPKKATVNEYQRKLNLKNGVTSISFIMEPVQFSEEKFASLFNIHIIPQKITIKTDRKTKLKVVEGIDADVWNLNGNHLKEIKFGNIDDMLYAESITYEKAQTIAVLSKTVISNIDLSNSPIEEKAYKYTRTVEFETDANQEITIIKYMICYHSNNVKNPLEHCLADSKNLNYNDLRKLNDKIWEENWRRYDIEINGNIQDELAIRYNTYQSIIATPIHDSLPVGARGLSCQAYQGAAFWDQEIFNLPMYLFTNPEVAKKMLIYRYNTLDGARRKEKRLGYEGAYYAWISGKTGDELCPDFFFKDVITGRPIRNHFNDWQIHITPDIAYSIWQYYELTDDYEFLRDYGAEIIFECARFLSSHVVYKPRKDRYEFVKIQGPDEYHENVENNAFTNYQAYFNFEKALRTIEILSDNDLDKILKKINLSQWEIELFKEIYRKLYLPQPNEEGVIEQFDNYFMLEDVVPASKIKERLIRDDEYYGWPNGVALFTQSIKQADVIQLFFVHPELFEIDIIKANYEYYESRTLHFSSLSPSVYSIIASRTGHIDEAYKKFVKSVYIDLKNTNEAISGGTFIGGIHTAAAGAAWQMIVKGFAGFKIQKEQIYLDPVLPEEWKSISFNLFLDGNTYQIIIDRKEMKIQFEKRNERYSKLIVKDTLYALNTGKTIIPF